MRKIIAAAAVAAGMFIAPAAAHADSPICHNGILSDDAGLHCADGLYEQVYGTGSPTSTHTASGYGTEASLNTSGYGAPPASIAQCESGGNPAAVSPDGLYYGKWQFSDATWHSVTGLSGHASAYSEATQDQAAAKLYAGGAGAGNWPVCSRR